MTTIDFTSYSRETLEHLLFIMKGYRTSLKQIGKRAVLIDPKNPPAIQARIEYPPSMETSSVEAYGLACIKKYFPDYNGEKPLLRVNPELIGGARVFVGDDMIDITFQRFESLIK